MQRRRADSRTKPSERIQNTVRFRPFADAWKMTIPSFCRRTAPNPVAHLVFLVRFDHARFPKDGSGSPDQRYRACLGISARSGTRHDYNRSRSNKFCKMAGLKTSLGLLPDLSAAIQSSRSWRRALLNPWSAKN